MDEGALGLLAVVPGVRLDNFRNLHSLNGLRQIESVPSPPDLSSLHYRPEIKNLTNYFWRRRAFWSKIVRNAAGIILLNKLNSFKCKKLDHNNKNFSNSKVLGLEILSRP